MNKIKHAINSVIATGVMFGAFNVSAAEVLPVLKDGFKLEPTVSIMGGMMQPTADGAESSTILGAEFSFRCVLLQLGDNQLRQQLSYTMAEKNGLSMQNIELNAHYRFTVAKDTSVGVGPGFGVMLTKQTGTDNPSFFGGQLGASIHYSGLGPVFLGAEGRYQLTNKAKFTDFSTEQDMNNWRIAAKLGYSF